MSQDLCYRDAATVPYSGGDSHLEMFDPSPYMSFTEFLHGPTDDNPISATNGPSKEEEKVAGGRETPATPNSSTSSSSDSGKSKKEKEPSIVKHQENSKKEYVYILFLSLWI